MPHTRSMRVRHAISMHTVCRALCLAGLLAAIGCAHTPAATQVEPVLHSLPGDGAVRVHWHAPSATRHSRLETQEQRQANMRTLARELHDAAKSVLPQGHRLDVTLTDVKRAGDYEPWLGPDYDQVRILRDLYPPRIALTYRHSDATGRTVAGGEAVLTDPGYLQAGAGMASSDPLVHEKRLLREWARRQLRGHP